MIDSRIQRRCGRRRTHCSLYLFSVLLAGFLTKAVAHEYWIEPVDFTVNRDAQVVAELRNGENFKGITLPFMPSQFNKFTITDPSGEMAVTSRLGDIPAVRYFPRQNGLNILAYQSKSQTLRYGKFSKFESFAVKEGIEWVLDEHARLKLPTAHIAEAYTRHSKAVIAVADAQGSDQFLGMPLELVLQNNPYVEDFQQPLQVQLLYEGKPLDSAQLSVFSKSTGLVERVRTNGQGMVALDLISGTYLLNAVHAKRPSEKLQTQTGALWQTFWASTTFAVP